MPQISCTTNHLYYQSDRILSSYIIYVIKCTTNQLHYSCHQSVVLPVLPISGTSTTNEPYYSYYTTACTYHQSAYSMSYQSAVLFVLPISHTLCTNVPPAPNTSWTTNHLLLLIKWLSLSVSQPEMERVCARKRNS